MALAWAFLACWVCLRCSVLGLAYGYDQESTAKVAAVLQWVSLLETVHAAFNIVPSGVLTNVLQWCGRAHALFLVIAPEPSLHGAGATCMLIAWGLGEASRYPKYMADNLGLKAPFLTWLRYTAFIPLYPVGLAAELVCMWQAIPLVSASGRLSIAAPQPVPMAFNYAHFLRGVLVVQPLLWSGIYRSLLRQRRHRLAPASKPKSPPAASATPDAVAPPERSRRAQSTAQQREDGPASASGWRGAGSQSCVQRSRTRTSLSPTKAIASSRSLSEPLEAAVSGKDSSW